MEDDEEIRSHPSPTTGSPPSSSSRPNGRITVTVAAAPPQSNNTLALALPIQQQQPRSAANGGGGGGGREDCWSEGATAVLIDAWGERYLELSRGNLKQKHWKEVADIVSSREEYTKPPKSDIQCKNRIDTVKKKYKTEKAKIAVTGAGASSKWPFYHRLDELIGQTLKIASSSAAASPSVVTPLISSGGFNKVPMGIPVGVRSVHQFQQQQQQRQNQQFLKRPPPIDSESSQSEPEPSRESTDDDCPPEAYQRKRPMLQMNSNTPCTAGGGNRKRGEGNDKNWGNSVRELTRAILKFGESYEQAESSKLQQLVEMEKQRMKFAKELELQRMQFFMKTQLELSQLKRHRRVGSSNSNHHHLLHHHQSNNNNNPSNNNHSDSSS